MRVLCLCCCFLLHLAAEHVYVTAFADPLTRLELHRLRASSEAALPPHLLSLEAAAMSELESVALPGTAWTIDRVVVSGLSPNTDCDFRWGAAAERVRTLPRSGTLRIASGGDTMHDPRWFVQTMQVLCAQDPQLIVFGGDLAYENGTDGQRFVQWLQLYARFARAPDGRLIPCISCIGNHEVQGQYGGSPAQAPYFYAAFSLDERAYQVVDIGERISFVLLDSAHTAPVEGAQTTWLNAVLTQRRGRVIIPVYHYPAWPSVKSPGAGKDPTQHPLALALRRHWVPLFEQSGVRVALEHDQHAQKRTVPLRAGQADTTGITYLGDGAWGVETRPIFPGQSWLASSASRRHGYVLDIHEDGHLSARALADDGSVLDSVEIPAP